MAKKMPPKTGDDLGFSHSALSLLLHWCYALKKANFQIKG